jgi:membrane-associated phospholipid phosphatase
VISFIQSIDVRVLESLYAVRSPEFVSIFIWASELGRATTLCGLSICVAIALALRRHFEAVMGLLTAMVTSGVGTFIIKGLVARPRPPESFWAYPEIWYSFPSAHAAMSLAFYGFIAFLAWYFAVRPSLRVLAAALAAILVLAIGFGRLYLGVHYMSDVLAGYLLGALCLWLGAWPAWAMRPRPVVIESPHGTL